MIDPLHVESLLKFLGIHRKLWQAAAEQTVFVTVLAIHFLSQSILWGAFRTCAAPTQSTATASVAEGPGEERTKRKSRWGNTGAALVCTDSNSPEADDLMVGPRQPRTRRARQPLGTRAASTAAAHHSHQAGPLSRASDLLTCPRTCVWRDQQKEILKGGSYGGARITTWVERVAAPCTCEESCRQAAGSSRTGARHGGCLPLLRF